MGVRFVTALLLLAVGLLLAINQGDTSWLAGVLGGVFAFGVWFAVALYVVHYRAATHKLKAMGNNPQALLEVSEDFLWVASGAGSASLPWSSVVAVWKLESCWLLLFSKSQFSTLPLASLSPELAEFVLARVRAAGGRIE